MLEMLSVILSHELDLMLLRLHEVLKAQKDAFLDLSIVDHPKQWSNLISSYYS